MEYALVIKKRIFIIIFRTTNVSESFNHGQFYNPHPPTHVVIEVLKQPQVQTLTKPIKLKFLILFYI